MFLTPSLIPPPATPQELLLQKQKQSQWPGLILPTHWKMIQPPHSHNHWKEILSVPGQRPVTQPLAPARILLSHRRSQCLTMNWVTCHHNKVLIIIKYKKCFIKKSISLTTNYCNREDKLQSYYYKIKIWDMWIKKWQITMYIYLPAEFVHFGGKVELIDHPKSIHCKTQNMKSFYHKYLLASIFYNTKLWNEFKEINRHTFTL